MRALILLAVLLFLPSALAKGEPFDIDITMTEKWEKPQNAVMFPVTLTSRVGTSVEIVFEVTETTGDLLAPMPRPILLTSAASATVPFAVQTPYHNGYLQETGTVTYQVSARDPDSKAPIGDAREVTVTVHTRGFYVPGPQLFGAMVAVALAAVVWRRR
jgi:hypothetical protein